MNHARPLLFLIAALVAIVLGNAAYRAITRPEPPMVIDELWTDAQVQICTVRPPPPPGMTPIPVQPSDAWRIV